MQPMTAVIDGNTRQLESTSITTHRGSPFQNRDLKRTS
jgi:hypothetical protein